jgi:hypothetical protein
MKHLALACECALLAVLGLTLCAQTVLAADNVIRPTCWDENVNGEVHHHCEVNRPDSKSPMPPQPHVANAPPPPDYGPPPYVPPQAWGPPPYRIAWCAPYEGPHCTRYYPPPPQAWAYYPPPAYYYPPPFFAFGFGPFNFVVP